MVNEGDWPPVVDGGCEDEAIAALLHDAVEDQDEPLERIAARYGSTVAAASWSNSCP